MKVAFPVAPEPEPEVAEAARQLVAGPVDFVKGVVARDGLPPADRPEVSFAGRRKSTISPWASRPIWSTCRVTALPRLRLRWWPSGRRC